MEFIENTRQKCLEAIDKGTIWEQRLCCHESKNIVCILDDFGFVFIYVTHLIFVSQLMFSSQKNRTIEQ